MRLRLVLSYTLILVMTLSFRAAGVRAERVIFVDVRTGDVQDGASWDSAYADLQDALDDVRKKGGCPCEIWIAWGTYKPDRGTGDRAMAFELPNQVWLYGGFDGTETCLDERDWVAHDTILSGDLNGDDDEEESMTPDPCCEPLYQCDNQSCRGKVIPLHEVCGRAWTRICSQFAFTHCCDIRRPQFRCDNSNNVVIAWDAGESVLLDGIIVSGGEARDFETLGAWGGGVFGRETPLVLRNCTIRQNAANYRAAVHTDYSPLTMEGCIVMENEEIADGAQVVSTFFSEVTVDRSRFMRNRGGGVWVRVAGRITDSVFTRNTEGRCVNAFGTLSVSNCDFFGNDSNNQGGTGIGGYDGHVRVLNSYFVGNRNISGGGCISGYGLTTLFNCVFAHNSADFAGAIDAVSGLVSNCTIVNNKADGAGGVWFSGTGYVRNSILYGNYDNDHGYDELAQLRSFGEEPVYVDYSIVQGWTGRYGGKDNVSIYPQFIDPLGPDGVAGTEDDDLRLKRNSPAINAGDPDFVPAAGAKDLDGHARMLCGRVDIGAYELGFGDFNCDRSIDLFDVQAWDDCLTGPIDGIIPYTPYPLGCEALDDDFDFDIDLDDIQSLQRAFIPPGP